MKVMIYRHNESKKIKCYFLRIPFSGMLRFVALVRTDVSEEISASIIRVRGISELGTTLAVTTNRRTLRRNTKCVGCHILLTLFLVHRFLSS
jgi:hypothetical protein